MEPTISTRTRTPWATIVFLVLIFLIVQHDFDPRGGQEMAAASAAEIANAVDHGSLTRELSVLALGVFGIVGLMRNGGNRLLINRWLGVVISLFVLCALASLVWAEAPGLTARRLVVLLAVGAAAAAVSKGFSLRNCALLGCVGSALYLMIGIVFELVFGLFQPFRFDYRFSGTLAPNEQGWNCAFLVLSAVAIAQTEKRGRALLIALALTGFLFLVLTASRSAFGATIIALLGYWHLVWPKRRQIAALLCLATALCFSLLYMRESFGPALRRGVLLGREESVDNLSGRMPVWEECLTYINRRPLLGYGFDSFWTPDRIRRISDEAGWGVPGAHNGYLEIVLSLGIVGGALYVAILLLAMQRSLGLYRRRKNYFDAYCFSIVLCFALIMLIEEIATQIPPTLANFIVTIILVRLGFAYEAPTNPGENIPSHVPV